jgi:hypothetical protein
MTTDSDRLLAAGAFPVTLSDGRTLNLRYTMRSLKMIEDTIGTLDLRRGMREDGKQVNTIVPALAAGLIHEDISLEEMWDLADPMHLAEYAPVILDAIDEAFPPAEVLDGPKKSAGKANGSRSRSRGKSGTSSRPSASGEPTKPSGT